MITFCQPLMNKSMKLDDNSGMRLTDEQKPLDIVDQPIRGDNELRERERERKENIFSISIRIYKQNMHIFHIDFS